MSDSQVPVTPVVDAQNPTAPVVKTPNTEPPPATPPVETPVEPKKADDKFGSKFAALSRREKEVIAKEEAAKAKIERANKIEELETKLKDDPIVFLELMEQYGITYDQLVNRIIDGDKPENKEIKAIKSELELIKKQDKEKQEAYAKEVESRGVQKMKQDFSSNIKANSETFELCAKFGDEALDLAYAVADELFKERGSKEIPDLNECLTIVEEHYLKEQEERLEKLKDSKKLGKFFNAQPKVEPVKSEVTPDAKTSDKKPASTTLSAALDSSAPVPNGQGPKTDEERMAEAIEKMKAYNRERAAKG